MCLLPTKSQIHTNIDVTPSTKPELRMLVTKLKARKFQQDLQPKTINIYVLEADTDQQTEQTTE